MSGTDVGAAEALALVGSAGHSMHGVPQVAPRPRRCRGYPGRGRECVGGGKKARGFRRGSVLDSATMDNDLKSQLATWKVEPTLPSGFQREVWARIAARETGRRSLFARWFGHWSALELWKPRYAVPVFALSAAISIGLAHIQAREANSQAWQTLENRYALSFNPIAQTSSQP